MSCAITSGRNEPCKDKVGGIKKLYLINFAVLAWTVDSTGVTAVTPNDSDIFEYDVRDATGIEVSSTSNRETGTTLHQATLTATLKGLTQADNEQIEAILKGRPICIVEDNNGTLWVLGAEFGCEGSGTMTIAPAMDGMYGYTLTLVARERRLPYQSAIAIAAIGTVSNTKTN